VLTTTFSEGRCASGKVTRIIITASGRSKQLGDAAAPAVKGAPGPAPGGGEGGLNAAASARRGAEAGEGGMVVAGGGFEPPTFGL